MNTASPSLDDPTWNAGRLGSAIACLVLAACAPGPAAGWSGYVEGEYVYVSSALGGTLTQLAVRAGDTVAAQAPLFTLDTDSEQAAVREAQARQAMAQAQVSNLQSGRRREEIDVVRAQLAQAQTAAAQSANDLQREQQLVAQGFVSNARLDALRSAVALAQARVAELQAQLRVAELPARHDERHAAQANRDAANAAVQQAAWREAQKQRNAPAPGLVTDTFFRVGEWVNPGQPVVSLLPPGAVKLRFYVPEGELAALPLGAAVQVRCDGCAANLRAKVSFVANRAEYTPPVIYSNAQRSKLVFLVEARLDDASGTQLKPGQPIEVSSGAKPIAP